MTDHPDTITVAKCHPFRGDNFYITLPGSDRSGVEYIRADLNAARIADLERQLAEVREVKPLEWFEVEKSRHGGKYTADGYTIRYIEGLWLLDFAGQSRSDWRFTTLAAAKLAAQADYTTRILSALKGPTP